MNDDMVAVYDAGSLTEARLLADRLESEGIDSFIDNDDSPLDGLTAGDQTVAVRVLPEQADRARRIVEAFEEEARP